MQYYVLGLRDKFYRYFIVVVLVMVFLILTLGINAIRSYFLGIVADDYQVTIESYTINHLQSLSHDVTNDINRLERDLRGVIAANDALIPFLEDSSVFQLEQWQRQGIRLSKELSYAIPYADRVRVFPVGIASVDPQSLSSEYAIDFSDIGQLYEGEEYREMILEAHNNDKTWQLSIVIPIFSKQDKVLGTLLIDTNFENILDISQSYSQAFGSISLVQRFNNNDYSQVVYGAKKQNDQYKRFIKVANTRWLISFTPFKETLDKLYIQENIAVKQDLVHYGVVIGFGLFFIGLLIISFIQKVSFVLLLGKVVDFYRQDITGKEIKKILKDHGLTKLISFLDELCIKVEVFRRVYDRELEDIKLNKAALGKQEDIMKCKKAQEKVKQWRIDPLQVYRDQDSSSLVDTRDLTADLVQDVKEATATIQRKDQPSSIAKPTNNESVSSDSDYSKSTDNIDHPLHLDHTHSADPIEEEAAVIKEPIIEKKKDSHIISFPTKKDKDSLQSKEDRDSKDDKKDSKDAIYKEPEKKVVNAKKSILRLSAKDD